MKFCYNNFIFLTRLPWKVFPVVLFVLTFKINTMNIANYLRLNINPKNRHKFITLGYACAITFAFILSLTNNNDVNASVAANQRFDYMMLEADVASNIGNPETIYPESSVENIKNLFNMVNNFKREEVLEKELKVSSGSTLISFLTDLGLSYSEANDVYYSLKKVFDPRDLKAGQKIAVKGKFDNQTNQLLELHNLTIAPQAGRRFVVEADAERQYVARLIKDELVDEVNSQTGIINGSVYAAMGAHGVPRKIAAEFVNVFKHAFDMRTIQKGDRFEIIYENKLTPDGQVVSTGNVLYAALIHRKQRIERYRFETSDGVEYYDEKGIAGRKTLSRKPMAYQQARISSPFGKRRHPIFKDLRIHWGVDYAAPRGSAVFAGGDGVVQVAKYNGAYGNYIKIRHNSEFSTAYGHMSGFAKGIRPGVRVKQGQLIGYVGSTGRSTGPHLHYEVVQNGKRVNPRTIKASAGDNLGGKNLKKFKAMVADLHKTHATMFAQNTPAKLAQK